MLRLSRIKLPTTFIAIYISLAVIPFSYGAEKVTDPNQGWVIPIESGALGSQNALFTDRSSDDRDYSALLDISKSGDNQVDITCDSAADLKCSESNQLIYYAQLPICQNSTSKNCIVSLVAFDTLGKAYPANFSRYFPNRAQNQFEGDPSINLPSGGAGSLFTIPGVDGPAGNMYYVSFIMSGEVTSHKQTRLRSVHASIFPVQLQDDQRFDGWKFCLSPSKTCDTGWNKLDAGNGKFIWNESGSQGTNCAETSWAEKLCAAKEAFPIGFSYALKVRLSLAPSGWLHGRMTNPEISIVQTGDVTELNVAASPVTVPTVYKHFQWNEMPSELQELYDPNTGKYKNSHGEGFSNTVVITSNPAERAWTTAPSPYSPTAISELNAWLPHVNDRATVIPSFWSFRSLSEGELKSANKCFSDSSRLNGIVTTNSTAYSPGPPEFDKVNGDLNYRVAAPHYLPNGIDTFRGTYDLVMQSPVARCIYGFSNAPVKGTVSVVSSNGTPQVATTVVSEKNGWLSLRAYNFEFSSPTVTVSLVQEASASSSVLPGATKAVQVKSTIKCYKGKLTKSVTSVKPKCPIGYKLK